MTKGITPVIAVILLLLITIAIIGFATGFFQNIVTTTGGNAETAASATSDRLQKTIDIIYASDEAITIKSTGTITVAASEVAILVDGAPLTIATACLTGALKSSASGTVLTCDDSTAPSLCTPGTSTVTVTAPGNSVSKPCA